MHSYVITIPAQPVGKGRGKAFATPAGIRVRTPEKTRSYEAIVRACALDAINLNGAGQITGPVTMHITAVWPRSQHLSRISKRTGQPLESCDRLPYTRSPDIDNVIKAIADGCNGILYKDDRQVVSVTASKWYAGMTPDNNGKYTEEMPHAKVVVTEWRP